MSLSHHNKGHFTPSHGRNVIICPLPWGLGHVTRCIPIALQLQQNRYSIYFALMKGHEEMVRKELPNASYIPFPGFKISYTKKKFLLLKLLLQLPMLVTAIIKEHLVIKKLVSRYKIDTIISDNRYGCYCRNTYNIFITHQLSPHLSHFKFIRPLINHIIGILVKKFDQCWIPDDPMHNLSGILSQTSLKLTDIQFVGIMSRFSIIEPEIPDLLPVFCWIAVISGPEPQRSIFETIVFQNFKETHKTCLIIRGKPDELDKPIKTGNVWMISYLSSAMLKHLLLTTPFIVCRSGYSSIMDLMALKRPGLLVPTPGQTEQEYLGKYVSNKGYFTFQEQEKINLPEAEKTIEQMEKQKATGYVKIFDLSSIDRSIKIQ